MRTIQLRLPLSSPLSSRLSTPGRALRPLALAAVVVVVAGGCGATDAGGDASAADTASTAPASTMPATSTAVPTQPTQPPQPTRPSAPRLPACDEVWSQETLPRRYLGCLEGDAVVEAMAFTCSTGATLVVYRDHYALGGRVINDTDGPAVRDPGYRRAIRACAA
ncbi:hypothetical protein [Nocardioides rubriscoriae]|uniref:hypothetical protein n=1 Tax=Nocardioides rubriscoriae TaxID=642762 RepID=UPI0011DF25C0|nr:hypothetical protein [Nocardioides rubriscoriae]